jgi:hypothetical protein
MCGDVGVGIVLMIDRARMMKGLLTGGDEEELERLVEGIEQL